MEQNNHSIFWIEIIDHDNQVSIKFDKSMLLNFLRHKGFFKKYLGRERIYINEVNNIISEVSTEKIQDFVVNYIRNIPPELLNKVKPKQIEKALIENVNYLFGNSTFSLLHEFNRELLRDTKTSAFFAFKNGIVEVSKENIILRDYSSYSSCIWGNQIINHHFNLDGSRCDFGKFISNISNKNKERFAALISSIGYLLHSYKNPSLTKAIVYCDEDSSSDLEGRTGKSLVIKSIGKLRNCLTLDGKNSKINESFSFQQVDLSTQIINFNDVNKNFNFESLFSIITEGLKVEKKYRDSFFIDFNDSPKIVITTNHTILGKGGSFQDRIFEIEFSSHYNKDYKPIDDFGRQFFYEWDKEEWNRFYSFMMYCTMFYLMYGLKYYAHINLPKRKLIQEFGDSFYKFLESIQVDKEYDKKELYKDFREFAGGNVTYEQRTFTTMIREFAKSKGMDVVEWKSNSKSYIKMIQKNS